MCPSNAGHTNHTTHPKHSRSHRTNPRPEPTPTRPPTGADLGHAIRQLRHKRQLTIEELAFTSNVHPTYVSGIERGRRNPTWEKTCSLAHGLGVTITDLSARAESAARVRKGTENVLEQERARQAGRPKEWAEAEAA